MTYAKGTTVTVDKSRVEIEGLLRKHGAAQFSSGWDDKVSFINFLYNGRHVAFILPLPDRSSEKFVEQYRNGRKIFRKNTPEKAYQLWEQACRERWRALVLVIKAKLEAVDTGITTFEQEFLAHIVIPGSSNITFGDAIIPQLDDAVAGKIKLLPMLEAQ